MIETSRRALLRAGALGVVLAPFVSAPDASAAVTSSRRLYTRARFRPLRRKKFRLIGTTGSWQVRLTKVSNLPHATRGAEHSFALTFRSSVAGPPQGTYTLTRARFASTTLFVVPSDASRRTYEAVINRAS